MSKKIPFKIERMDPLGQGVSKEKGVITFIPKTLPGESGLCQIEHKKGKNIQFGAIQDLQEASPRRAEALCPHFKKCSGCSYLHTDYEYECFLKKEAYSFLFKKLGQSEGDILYHLAPHRHHYRNRIQLHYNKKQKTLGFRSRKGILEVPDCKLPQGPIGTALEELYRDKHWLTLINNQDPTEGHLELFLKEEKVEVVKNSSYSHGGFRQVFEEMGKLARQQIHNVEKQEDFSCDLVIDLFGGSGFLSEGLSLSQVIIDYGDRTFPSNDHRLYMDLNIYQKDAFNLIKKEIEVHYAERDNIWLILDPPRSGLKNLSDLIKLLPIERISYLSCNPSTQVRDLQEVLSLGHQIESVEFFDFFPGTHHLESLVHLKRSAH